MLRKRAMKDLQTEMDEVRTRLVSSHSIPGNEVQDWMSSRFGEVRDAAFTLLFGHRDRVLDLLDAEINEFFLRYFDERIAVNGTSASGPSRFESADLLRIWFSQLWQKRPTTNATLRDLKSTIERLLLLRNADVSEAVLLGTLEHLFVDFQIEKYFHDWKGTPILREVYSEACELARRWRQL